MWYETGNYQSRGTTLGRNLIHSVTYYFVRVYIYFKTLVLLAVPKGFNALIKISDSSESEACIDLIESMS